MDSPITVKAALLQALIRREGYGLDLIERIKKETRGEIAPHQGSVYPALRDLEDEKLVTSYEGPPLPERGGRPRRYYKLTALGQKAALEQARVVSSFFAVPELA